MTRKTATRRFAPKQGLTPVVPPEAERPVNKKLRVNLLEVVELLHQILTPSLCRTVFKQVRNTEREGQWTLHALVQFWMAMIIRNPSSMRHGIEETRKRAGRDKLWPYVPTAVNALFDRCAELRQDFFQRLYEAFVEQLLPQAPAAYASWMEPLREHFPDVLIVDGSKLDAIAHRLQILWKERGVVLPGCLTVYYDLFRGFARRVYFYADAAAAEMPRAVETLNWIPQGALLIGDRLYSSSIKFFELLAELRIYGVFRLNGVLKVKRIEVLVTHQGGKEFVEDAIVEVGSGQNGTKKRRLRRIRYRGHGIRRDILVSVLDPKKLSWEQILAIYRLRWSIERMFLDIKETLDLHGIYASHPNTVAMQAYATALVHAAFRVAQARIALKSKVLPEQISPAKLFPKLADTSFNWANSQLTMVGVRQSNPGVTIKEPNWNKMAFAYTRLGAIVVERRKSERRQRRFCAARKKWKSLAHVSGGPTLLRSATVH